MPPNESRREPASGLVVGVGVSANDSSALERLLPTLPSNHGMTFFVTTREASAYDGSFAERLTQTTSMRVFPAEHGAILSPNTVYVVRPDAVVEVHNGTIALAAPEPKKGARATIDHLFRSLAREFRSRAVGILLAEGEQDRNPGLKDIKDVGGLTIALRPAGRERSGNVEDVLDTEAVDLVLDAGDVAKALLRFAAAPDLETTAATDSDEGVDLPRALNNTQLLDLAQLLAAESVLDLRVYKPGTIGRRVVRRLMVSGLHSVDEYLDILRHDATERKALARDLLIGVTDFFRDKEAFLFLREKVIDPLVAEAPEGMTLRAWIPGCATGEEAYSIAMEFLDSIQAQERRLSLLVFATDIDQVALDVGRSGVYPRSVASRIPQARLQRYFDEIEGNKYRAKSHLRDVLSFATHDLTRDPPFFRMDLVSCRNVLIYFKPDVQHHVLKVLHFALQPGCYLFLGTSESNGTQRDLFATVSKKWRIYRRVGGSRPFNIAQYKPRSSFKSYSPSFKTIDDDDAIAQAPRRFRDDQAHQLLLNARVPPSIIISEEGSVLFMHGELRPYLRFPNGADPRLALSSIVTPELATRTRGALYKCRRNNETVVALSSPDPQHQARTRITATPAFQLGDGAVILTFEQVDHHTAPATPDSPEQEAVIDELEQELLATREDLRQSVEELETSNEELRTTNEEAMSMNEELQCTNEELEATSEALRALNEKLTSVNGRLREKVEQLEQAHNDLSNFFSSTKVATFFLDEHLCIKRFTPAAAELLHVDQADVGRFVSDIARELLQNDLEADAKYVLSHLSPRSREMLTGKGRWFVRQVLPYRTESRRIEGVIVTLVDVTESKRATAQAERLAAITESSHDAIFCYDREGRITEWLAGAERLYGYTAEEAVGTSFERLVPPHEREKLSSINARVQRGELVGLLETTRQRKDGTLVTVSVRCSPIRAKDGHIYGVSSIDRDISSHQEAEKRLLMANRQKDEFLAMLGHELRNPLTAVRSAAELLRPGCESDPKLQRIQAILERQSSHMSKLIDGLLDVSRIIHGKIAIERQPVDLSRICHEVADVTAHHIAPKNLELSVELPETPVWVVGDKVRLAQIVDNLLSNAVKYTQAPGQVRLRLEVASSPNSDSGQAVLTVADTGMGIDAELLPHVFDVFRQAKQTADRGHGGLGLGLALVKSLVELHDGQVEAKSDGEQRGAEFTVKLPTTSQRTIGSSRPPAGVEPLRILIIEDNQDAAELLQQLLQLSGHSVSISATGSDGVAQAKAQLPHVVLCDLGLPGALTGFDVAQELRAHPSTASTRLFALSGYSRPEDKARCAEAGFDGHLSKPIDVNALRKLLQSDGDGPERG